MKGILFLYIAGGLSASAMIEPYVHNKNPPSQKAIIGVAVAVAVLLCWNIVMYRNAAASTGESAGKSAIERFTQPVAASLGFVGGLVALLI